MKNNAINNLKMNQGQIKYDKIIIGLGKTGLASARYLSQKNINFAVMDSRTQPPMLSQIKQELPDLDLYLGEFDEGLLCQTNEVIISPGVSLQEPAIQTALKNNIHFVSDVEIFCQHVSSPIIAVTGSNGKSTVVSILAEVIKQSGLSVGLGGNIGTPVLELIKDEEPDIYVLELSSFQLETVYSLNAKAAVVLNVSEDHMDRYPDLASYSAAKSRIYQGDGLVVLNRDDPLVMQYQQSERTVITFGSGIPKQQHYGLISKEGRLALSKGKKHLLFADEMKIRGIHNYVNALAVFALAESISIPVNDILTVLKQYQGLPHRCQWIANINGVDWFNDSKGTNVGATLAAITGLTEKKNLILIAGGVSKDADFSPLKAVVRERVKTTIVYGRDAKLIAKTIKEDVEVKFVDDLLQAVQLANQISQQNDMVLFSPACASFDMFENYEERGQIFIEHVQNLKEEIL